MFSSPILDLIVALSFTYFVLSLTVSTIHEFIYSVIGCKRGIYLKNAIENLFYNDENWKKLAAKIFDNPNIIALKDDNKANPSYIPSKNFALALLDQFKSNADGTYNYALLDMNKIREKLLDNNEASVIGIDGALRKVLISLFERAQGDFQNFQKQIEAYYDDAMERAAGIYVRSAKKVILIIAIILSALLNADTIHITKTLWQNPDVLKQTADNIQETLKNVSVSKDSSGHYNLSDVTLRDDKVIITKDKDTLHKDTLKNSAVDTLVHQIKQTVVYLRSTGIPIGWSKDNIPQDNCWEGLWEWIIKITGILLTAAALMLGAPFWFDLINKIVNLRAAGKKPDDTVSSTNTNNNNNSTTQNAVG